MGLKRQHFVQQACLAVVRDLDFALSLCKAASIFLESWKINVGHTKSGQLPAWIERLKRSGFAVQQEAPVSETFFSGNEQQQISRASRLSEVPPRLETLFPTELRNAWALVARDEP